jgi:DNA-binding NtrC family response regulator
MPKKQVIAIVDDDELAREGTIDLVKSMGFIAKAFERAEDFLKSDYLHSSSCLIADVLMPGMTGIELHKRLVEAGNITPTILITSFPNDRDRARARGRPVRFATWPSHSMTKICSPASVQLSSPARRSETFQEEP